MRQPWDRISEEMVDLLLDVIAGAPTAFRDAADHAHRARDGLNASGRAGPGI